MSHQPDRDVVAVSSKRNRNCNSTLHRCFIAVETAGSSRNSIMLSPEKSCFNGQKQAVQKGTFSYTKNDCAVSLPLKQQKSQETAKRNRPLAPFDACLIWQNALDIVSSPSLGENRRKNLDLSSFLSPFTFKQVWVNSFIED